MDAVNLLPPEYRAHRRSAFSVGGFSGRKVIELGGAVAVLFAVVLGLLYFHERSTVHSKQSELARVQGRIAAVEAQVQAVQAAQAAASGRLSVVQSVSEGRMNWDRALGDLARVLPTDSYLTSLQIGSPGTSASAFTINGVAPGTVRVAAVLDRLALLPWLSGVTLTSTSRQDTGANQFSITAGVAQER